MDICAVLICFISKINHCYSQRGVLARELQGKVKVKLSLYFN